MIKNFFVIICLGLVFIITSCEDDEPCYITTYQHDGHGNSYEQKTEVDCDLGQPVDAPVITKEN